MRPLVTAAQMGAIEKESARLGVSTLALMQKAGTALAEEALKLAAPAGRFVVLCGRGNNGGDGLVAARRLTAAGREVLCELLPGDDARLPPEASNALATAGFAPRRVPAELALGRGDVVLDCLFGTGLSRAPAGEAADAIGRIARWRAAGAKVLAADVPSGLQADTGRPFTSCVQADVTVTFGERKVGLELEPGVSLAGHVEVADIGLPKEALHAAPGPSAFLLDEADVLARVPVRAGDSHKGTYGHVLVVAGSMGKTGAAALAAMGALRGGAGLVTVATSHEALPLVMAHAPEMMGVSLGGVASLGESDLPALLDAADGKQALVIGPGIPRGDDTAALLRALFEALAIPIVVDADALNAIGGERGLLGHTRAPLVVTPHPGEMARLLGRSTAEVQGDRLAAARELARGGATVVLKGARTVIAQQDGTAWVNPTGNPGMASGGTGDVLAGLCGALLAQGLAPADAALVAVYVHGLAGDLAARRRGHLGLVATDLLAGLGEVWATWRR